MGHRKKKSICIDSYRYRTYLEIQDFDAAKTNNMENDRIIDSYPPTKACWILYFGDTSSYIAKCTSNLLQ